MQEGVAFTRTINTSLEALSAISPADIWMSDGNESILWGVDVHQNI